jgi:hypothetical protein
LEEDLMSLIDEFKVPCTLIEKTRTPDGEGGWVTTWSDGPQFMAAIVMDNTLNARVARQDGMKAVYTVTVDRSAPLDFHDVFRRDSDGQVFRVTSDSTDKETPDRATFQFAQVSAEEWELTDG